MIRVRRIGFENGVLQALAIFLFSGVATFLLWFLVWPFGARLWLACLNGVLVALFCAWGSLLRGRDLSWERQKVPTLPWAHRRQARRNARSSPGNSIPSQK